MLGWSIGSDVYVCVGKVDEIVEIVKDNPRRRGTERVQSGPLLYDKP